MSRSNRNRGGGGGKSALDEDDIWEMEEDYFDRRPQRTGGQNRGGGGGRGNRGGRGGGKAPPGLRGRDIGLWHAKKHVKARAEREDKERPVIAIGNKRELSTNLKYVADKLQLDGGSIEGKDERENQTVTWRQNSGVHGGQAAASTSGGSQKFFANEEPSDDEEPDESASADLRSTTSESRSDGASNFQPTSAEDEEEEETEEDFEELLTVQMDAGVISAAFDARDAQYQRRQLSKDPKMDEFLRRDLVRHQQSAKVNDLLEFRKKLPAFQRQDDFVRLTRSNRVIVVSGLTGCGKSTQLPQALLDDMIKNGDGSTTHIVCTQPRRISAISLAERVADERGENMKKDTRQERSIGYQIRLESRLPRDCGSLVYCTTGIVLRLLTADPTLTGVSHLFLDEIHERDLQSDLLLILIRDLLKYRPDLRVILMSATLEAQTFLNYFVDFNAAMFEIAGRSFPVQRVFLEDICEMIRYRPGPTACRKRHDRVPAWKLKRDGRGALEEKKIRQQQQIRALRDKKYSMGTIDVLAEWDEEDEKIDADLVHRLVRQICDSTDQRGAILIFVPGYQDIKDVLDRFKRDTYFSSASRFVILPLHSMIPTFDQQKVFARPSSTGCRKIIVSTNIAETSVTIDDVIYVIDCGKIKRQNFDKESNCQTLKSEWVSKANAVQRQGRAGRCQPGVCYHLFPEWKFDELDERSEPEMRRTRLTSLCLDIKALTKSFSTLERDDTSALRFLSKAIDPPDEESIKLALDDLYALGALTTDEELTPLGWNLIKFPVDPHCAKMIIYSALFSCVDPVLTIAACLDYKDPFHQPFGMEQQVDECKQYLQWPSDDVKSDYLLWVTAFNMWRDCGSDRERRDYAYYHFLSDATLKFIDKMKKQFAVLLFDAGFIGSSDPLDAGSNKNSMSERVLEAVIAAGLYPKVAYVAHQVEKYKASSSHRPPNLRLKNGQYVKIHPSSVNSKVVHFESRHLIYQASLKSTAHFLRECSMASPMALCLAGRRIRRHEDSVILDDWLRFYIDRESYELIDEMRRLMATVLKRLLEKTSSGASSVEADGEDRGIREAQGKLTNTLSMVLKGERLVFRD